MRLNGCRMGQRRAAAADRNICLRASRLYLPMRGFYASPQPPAARTLQLSAALACMPSACSVAAHPGFGGRKPALRCQSSCASVLSAAPASQRVM